MKFGTAIVSFVITGAAEAHFTYRLKLNFAHVPHFSFIAGKTGTGIKMY
jgi:hypothetical protein